jgi:hypothetical protein
MNEPLVLRPSGRPKAQAALWGAAGLVAFAASLAFEAFSGAGLFLRNLAVFCFVLAFALLWRGRGATELRLEPEHLVHSGAPIPWAAIADVRVRPGIRASVVLHVRAAPGYWEPPRSGLVTIDSRSLGKEPEELAEIIRAYRDRATGQVTGP